jgi:hypothetical protein
MENDNQIYTAEIMIILFWVAGFIVGWGLRGVIMNKVFYQELSKILKREESIGKCLKNNQ